MPYIPSFKTDGKSDDRKLVDEKVEVLAKDLVANVRTNFDIPALYVRSFLIIGHKLFDLVAERQSKVVDQNQDKATIDLAQTIYDIGKKYKYDGAFLGILNYSITRLIQRVPKVRVEEKKLPEKEELRYWLYAVTVEALTQAAFELQRLGLGIGGVFEDIKDEYKRRVNVSYEAAQIIKSGDCYDAPYYTRLAEVRDDQGNLIGYQEIMLKRSSETLDKDVLDEVFVLQKKKVEVAN